MAGNDKAIAALRRKLAITTEETKRIEMIRVLESLGYVEPADEEKVPEEKAAPAERHPAEHKTADAPTTGKRGPGRPRGSGK